MQEEAKANHAALSEYDVDGIDVLRLIALREHLRQRDQKARGSLGKMTVRGVRQSDVLGLEPDVVKNEWDAAIEGIVSTLAFLREGCGVIRGNLVPASSMVLPLADALGFEAPRAGFDKDLKDWFWASTLSQEYAQGANTQAVADALQLRAWNADPASRPASVRDFQFEKDDLLESRRRNEILLRGVACLLIKRDAWDWIGAKRLIEIDGIQEIEHHHVFAEKFLENRKIDPDVVINFTPITKATNASLRSDHPSEVVERADVDTAAVETAQINVAWMENNDWNAFKAGRQKSLMVLIDSIASGFKD